MNKYPDYSNQGTAAAQQFYPTFPHFAGLHNYQQTFHQMYRQPEGFPTQYRFPFQHQLPANPYSWPPHQPQAPQVEPQAPQVVHQAPQVGPQGGQQRPHLPRPPHLEILPRQNTPPPTPANSSPSPPQMRQIFPALPPTPDSA